MFIEAVAHLISFIWKRKRPSAPKIQEAIPSIRALNKVRNVVIQTAQHESYGEEIYCRKSSGTLPKTNPLIKLSTIIDADGLLRVGGRLKRSGLRECSNPLQCQHRQRAQFFPIRTSQLANNIYVLCDLYSCSRRRQPDNCKPF